MKKKDKEQIRQKSKQALQKEVEKLKKELAYAILSQGEEKDTNKVKKIRHKIAVIKTIIHEKEIVEEMSKGGGVNE